MDTLKTLTYETTGRVARNPINQLMMMKLLVNQALLAAGVQSGQILGTVFDGIARHTPEGYAFQGRAAEAGFRHKPRRSLRRHRPFAFTRHS